VTRVTEAGADACYTRAQQLSRGPRAGDALKVLKLQLANLTV